MRKALRWPSITDHVEISGGHGATNEGLLSVHATVPLNAPDFRYELEGTLGPMQATAFNRFLAESEPIKP